MLYNMNMTAERPGIGDVAKLNEAPLFVSAETAATAFPVAASLAKGKQPDKKDVDAMVARVAFDLKGQGVKLSSDDIRAMQERTEKGLSSSPPSEPVPKFERKSLRPQELPTNIDLNEYQQVLNDFVHNYGMDRKAWNKISAILVGSELSGQALGAAQRAQFETGSGFGKLQHYFEDISKQLKLTEKTPGQFWNAIWKREPGSYTKTDAKAVVPIVIKALWPVIASPVYWFADQQARNIAGKMFFAERGKLQEQVNNRIADSLYMRNFEFLHDKSAGEMIEVLNRGKDATIDLVSAIYEELIPLKWAQNGMIGSQALFDYLNPIDAVGGKRPMWMTLVQYSDLVSAAFKKLLLDTKIKPNAQRIQQQRAEELAQWDTVNTKLLTTLQGLETVRTAGNAEAGSDMLYGSLAKRDFVEQGGLREKRLQEKKLNQLLDVLDTALPFASTAVRSAFFIKNGQAEDEQTHMPRGINAREMLFDLWGSAAQFRGSRAEQMALRQSFLQLTHLYTDRIIPDIQDIKRMEEMLGPYDTLDIPEGPLEQARVGVSKLSNFDITVDHLKFKNILHDVSLNIPQGSFVTIKGPSGIGKSTLLRHLVGLYNGEKGAVQYGGVDINGVKKYGDDSLYAKIAYANQNPQYFEDMTLRENLLLWTKTKIPDERIEGVLHDLNLDKIIGRLDDKSKHFSGGEMRRIGIARALLKDPKVLFLDEPTANLDAVSTAQVMKIIQELRKKRPDMTVVAVTHDPVFEKFSEKVIDFEKLNVPRNPLTIGDHQVLEAVAKPN